MKKLFEFYLNDRNKKYLYLLVCLFLIFMYLLLLLKTAWIGDDAYITFRTIDNFVNGYGLRWNIPERVQSYTHPLWLFLLSAIYFFTREIFFTAIITSIIISIITVYLLAFKLTRSYKNIFMVLLAVIFSKAFIDYSTSGLENPLTNLLLVLFFYTYLREEYNKNIQTFLLSLISALLLTNRIDCFLLVLPAFSYYLIKSKNYKRFIYILLGFLPFILWELFSLLYYGFPFPNTAYAKLNTGIPMSELILEGFKYIKESFIVDPITIILIISSMILILVNRNKDLLLLSIGIFLYVFYLVWIGGDFMVGRFFTAPFIIALIIISNIKINRIQGLIILTLTIIIPGIISINNTLYNKSFETNYKSIVDERLLYYRDSNLIAALRGEEMPKHIWVQRGKMAKKEKLKFIDLYSTGFFGYFAGNDCFILDKLALSDPLLSKLPCEKPWRIGHYKRNIPDGYIETLKSNTNQIKDAGLAQYYKKLSLISRENIFSSERLKEIIFLNLGKYDLLLKNYSSNNIK